MTKAQRKKAVEILENYNVEAVYMNPMGEFFTEKHLGDNSLKQGETLEVVKRKAVSDSKEKADKTAEEKAQIEAEKQAYTNS